MEVKELTGWFCSIQYVEDNLGVMSVGFLLSSPSDAVIWRGPKKNGKNVSFHSGLWQENSHSQCAYQSNYLSRLRKCYSFVNPSFPRHQGKGNALISGNWGISGFANIL